ncbi:hypothetical protein KFL_002960030 [Klebsormidium nitens]|uniref:DUF1517 domain-containing protein n=1 Tax=Klebsormidium nitens TaxID=105231 RepID=A0A1Y1IEL0_KLENI|nr:hypothetical protein KFL_002960030 [Klebsormidium nitens]|eukprot:GAQ86548.1 hypothetical protein KFL_002960030 [Klebsormidium nitens]
MAAVCTAPGAALAVLNTAGLGTRQRVSNRTAAAPLLSSKSAYLGTSECFGCTLLQTVRRRRSREGVARSSLRVEPCVEENAFPQKHAEAEAPIEKKLRVVDTPLQHFLLQKAGEIFSSVLKVAKQPVLVAALVAMLMTSFSGDALAATSGGRVGGSAFSSSRSSSSGGGSYSRSGSGGYSSGSSYSAPSLGGGYGSGIYSAPYAAPYTSYYGGFSPFGFSPFSFFAPSIGVGVGYGGSSIFTFLLFGMLALFLVQTVGSAISSRSDGGILGGGDAVSVMRLQVGLLGNARTLQRDLERIADRADTSTTSGLHYVLTETVLSLLRHPEYCVYGRGTTDKAKSFENAEASFNQLSLEERRKFEQETYVNVNSLKKKGGFNPKGDGFGNEYIVVTVIVAAEGNLKLPSVRSAEDLRQALTTLGSVPVDQLQAVEILWTPQDANDTLSETELLHDYPSLTAL